MQTVRYKGVVCFAMHYDGAMNDLFGETERKKVYACLKEALQVLDTRHPWRGPRVMWASNGLRYMNDWNGDCKSFNGHEEIIYNGFHVYKADYAGGIVNVWGGM